MMSSFDRKTSSGDMLSGLRMSAKGMQVMSSSGIPSLDQLFGGGFPVNSITLLEEDKHSIYSSMIAKCFISDAIEYNQQIIISSPTISTINTRFLRELPTHSQSKNTNLMGDDMTIAWRYQSLPVLSANTSTVAQYDFGQNICEQKLNSADIEFCSHNSLIDHLKSSKTNDKTVTRVVIEGLGSPLSSIDIKYLPQFVYELKSLIRRLPNVLCLITFCSEVILSSNFSFVRSRVHNSVDTIIQLIAFDDSTQTPYKEYNGLFNVIKFPKLNSLDFYFTPETLDIGFQLKNNSRYLLIDKLCLPPDLSETVSRTTSCAQTNKTLDF